MKNKLSTIPVLKQADYIKTDKVPSIIRNLASALIIKLQINPNKSLACIIGSGHEQSNLDAVETWILTEIGKHAIKTMDAPLDQLAESLQNYLRSKLDQWED